MGDAADVTGEESTWPDGQLLIRARSDPAAFSRLYRRHYDGIFRYCLHRLFDRAAAEDATSAVFLRMLERLDRFSGDEELDLRNWLLAIATNLINDQCRRRRLWERFLKLQGRPSAAHRQPPEHSPEADERLAHLQKAIRGLKPREQALITLRFFEDLDIQQIAQALGGSPATVRSQLSRALRRLRRRLETPESDSSTKVSNHV